MRNPILALVAMVLTIGAVSGQASATVHTFAANLDGLQEVPPNASPAFGQVDLTLDDTSGLVTVTSGSYQDLLGNSTAVTLNGMAAAGSNAPSLFALTLDTPGAASGTISGSGTLSGIMAINGMIAGNTYINIRSNVVPSGEIRGQILETPEPATIGILTLASIGLLRRHRPH